MTKNADKCVPALRFKGFNNDWAQRKLENLTNRVKSYSISHDAEVNQITGTKYIHYGDIHTGKVTRIQNESILPNIHDNNFVPLKNGDVIVADASEDYKGIADACVIDLPYQSYKIVSGLHTIAFRPNKELKPDFLYTYLHTSTFKHYGYRMGTGLKVFGISYKNLANMLIKLPDTKEQDKINKVLSLITYRIKLQQRKAKQLKLLKKAMLQDLFTDKNVPKLRFNGFDANWIQCKLEKEALLTMGQSPSGSTYSDQPSTYILVQGNADLKNGWVKPRIWTTQITKLAKKGDIIITVRAPAGKVGRTNFDVVLGRGVASIQGNDFIFYLLSKMDMNKYWKKYAAGSTFESINSNDIKNTRVHVPNLPEQNRIANLFLRLDDLIRFQQNKLNNLQKTKQFLLQNMFI